MDELSEGLHKLAIAYVRVRIAYKDLRDAKRRHVTILDEMAYLKRLRIHSINLIDRLADIDAWRSWLARQTKLNG